MKDILEKLELHRDHARLGGGKQRIEAQHKRGKLTARERIALLLDRNSFEEFDTFVEHRCDEFGMAKAKIPGDGFVTGPEVVKTVTNEVVTSEELGGASVHTTKSGVADGAYENDLECLLQMRRLVDFLPANNAAGVPEWPSFDDPDREDRSLDTLV